MTSISTKEIKRLLLSHNLFVFARTLAIVFVNLFIWSLTQDLFQIALYNALWLVAHTASFTLGAPLVKKGYTNILKIVGLLGTIVFFVILFFLEAGAVDYIPQLAILYGLVNGLYWICYHVQSFDITHPKNRGHFSGVEQAFRTLIILLAPITGGALISFNIFGHGYGSVFLLAALLTVLSIIFGSIETKTKPLGAFHLRKTMAHVFADRDFSKIMASAALSGFSISGALRELIPLFIFIIFQSEFEVGSIISLFTVFSMVTIYFSGKHIGYNQYKRVILYAGILFSVSLLGLVALPGLLMYIVLGSVKEMMTPLMNLPRRVYYQNLLHRLKDYKKHRVEYIVIREWSTLIAGRLPSFLILLIFASLTSGGISILLIAMAAGIFIETFVIRSIKTDLTTL